MDVDCEGCAGCCVDWRPLVPEPDDHERRGPRTPLDDVYNLVPLTRDDVRAFLDAGLADALTPRLWVDEDGIAIDGRRLAAVDGKPAFFLGLRKPPKPVAPFGVDPSWLRACVFLDPATLQCRIHDTELYPRECAEYPGQNLRLGAETECERVEATFGGERLLDDSVPESLSPPLFGPQAIGQTVFVHPDSDRLVGVIDRIVEGTLSTADRAEFVAAAVAGAPGTAQTNEDAFATAYERSLAADSWAGRAIAAWSRLVGEEPGPGLAERVEEERGAPRTPGWS